MLRCGSHAFALHTLHIARGNHSGEQWILGIILMVAATQRRAHQIHGRGKYPVQSILLHLIADGLTYSVSSLTIPRGSHSHGSREISSQIVAVIPRACGTHTQSLLTVGTVDRGDTQSGDGIAAARRSRELRVIIEMHSAAEQQMAFLIQCHGLQHLVDIVGTKPWL